MLTAHEKRIVDGIVKGKTQKIRVYSIILIILFIAGCLVAKSYAISRVAARIDSIGATPNPFVKFKVQTQREDYLKRLLIEEEEERIRYSKKVSVMMVNRDYNVLAFFGVVLLLGTLVTLPLERIIRKLSEKRLAGTD